MTCVCVLAAVAAPNAQAEPDRSRPNIVVILADDVGYGDLSCYGATKVKTPNLDKLAAAGMRFTDGHCSAAVCTPTRYSLLTGQYAWRHKPARSIMTGVAPLAIPLDRLTAPKLLKKAGYTTGVVGKWHLGLGSEESDYNAVLEPGPHAVGFDYSFIIPATGDRTPCVYVENGRVVNHDPNDPIRVSYKAKVGDEPVGTDRNPDQLFNEKPIRGRDGTIVNGISRIGYMSGGKAAWWKDEDMADELTRRAVSFIDNSVDNSKEKPFFLYFATHDAHAPTFPHPRFRGKSEHGVRGDAIVQLDWCVGELLAALDKYELADNTLVIFTSDNGGVGDKSGHKSNGVLRGFKGSPYEGGTRVPFIARWPGVVPASQTSGALISSVDLLATCAAITGQKLADDDGPDSFNLLPALRSEKPQQPCRESLVTQSQANGLAIRAANWKLIPAVEMAEKSRPAELYDLEKDLSESNNLAAQQPEKVNHLNALLVELQRMGRSRAVGK